MGSLIVRNILKFVVMKIFFIITKKGKETNPSIHGIDGDAIPPQKNWLVKYFGAIGPFLSH